MQIQPKTHETTLRELRTERRSEEQKLSVLKERVEEALGKKQVLFGSHPNGHVNAA